MNLFHDWMINAGLVFEGSGIRGVCVCVCGIGIPPQIKLNQCPPVIKPMHTIPKEISIANAV